MQDELQKVGTRLIALRKKINKTQQEISDNIEGITPQLLSAYENNKQKPGIENLIKFSKYFNVSLDFLCYGKESSQENIKIKNYGDLLRILIEIEKTGIITFHANLQKDFYDEHNICADFQDPYIHKFYEDLYRLNNAKDIIGEDLYKDALENLFLKYETIALPNK